MAKRTSNQYALHTLRCAACSCCQIRTEVGHHWLITVVSAGKFVCRSYDPQLPLRRSERPVCGQGCALRVFDSFLGTLYASPKKLSANLISQKASGLNRDTASDLNSDTAIPPPMRC
jgi:hypothetical protein